MSGVAGIYSYEYMDNYHKLNEPSLPEKNINSILTMEDVADAEYKHVKRNWEYFGIQNPGDYPDL